MGGSDDEMRFVGNHFIEISTGMERKAGKKRKRDRENCKSRAIPRRFFKTDHAKGDKERRRRGERLMLRGNSIFIWKSGSVGTSGVVEKGRKGDNCNLLSKE